MNINCKNKLLCTYKIIKKSVHEHNVFYISSTFLITIKNVILYHVYLKYTYLFIRVVNTTKTLNLFNTIRFLKKKFLRNLYNLEH